MPFEPKCDLVAQSAEYTNVDLLGAQYDATAQSAPQLILELTSSSRGGFCVTFDEVDAFRFIDEGQVTEFWNSYSTSNGWLWLVQSGGWLELESLRDTFWLPEAPGPLREYLIVGNTCAFVLSRYSPKFPESQARRM